MLVSIQSLVSITRRERKKGTESKQIWGKIRAIGEWTKGIEERGGLNQALSFFHSRLYNNAARARLTGAQRAPGCERNTQQIVIIIQIITHRRHADITTTACSAPALSFSCLSSPRLLVPSRPATPRTVLSFPFSFPSVFFRSRIQPNLFKRRKNHAPHPCTTPAPSHPLPKAYANRVIHGVPSTETHPVRQPPSSARKPIHRTERDTSTIATSRVTPPSNRTTKVVDDFCTRLDNNHAVHHP